MSRPPHPLRYFVVDDEPLRVGCFVETESNRVELVTCWREGDLPSRICSGVELTFSRRDYQLGWWSVSPQVPPTFKVLKPNTRAEPMLPVFYLSALGPKPYYYPPRGPPVVPGGTPLCTAIGDLWGVVDDAGIQWSLD